MTKSRTHAAKFFHFFSMQTLETYIFPSVYGIHKKVIKETK